MSGMTDLEKRIAQRMAEWSSLSLYAEQHRTYECGAARKRLTELGKELDCAWDEHTRLCGCEFAR